MSDKQKSTGWIVGDKYEYILIYTQWYLEKHTLVYYPNRPPSCLTNGVAVVSCNDGEASAGEADFSRILSGAFVHSAHRQETNVGQKRSNRAESQGWGENAVVVVFGCSSIVSAYFVG